ncbi:hypothetical protein ACWD7F_08365 [Streptomyces sp. NPDC005122]
MGHWSSGTSAHPSYGLCLVPAYGIPYRRERAPDWRESVEPWQKCHFCKIRTAHSVTP